MTNLPKIDIIVPCYKAQNILPRLLGSLMCQSIKEDIDVTLVNDGEESGAYKQIIEQFSPFLSIKEVGYKNNSGPGTARRYGYEQTSNPLVMWCDADDSISGAYALNILRKKLLEEPYNVACFGGFLEEQENDLYLNHANDSVWMFGKIYKRAFLDKYNIKMNDTRANEDNGFNMMCKLLSSEQERIKYIPDIIYYWHINPNSITRINNCQYSYDQSFVGYTDNMIWALKEAEKRNPFNGNILMQKVVIFMNLYEYFLETFGRDKRFVEQNWNKCKDYYREIYREVKDKIPEQTFIQAYNDVMRNNYMGNKLNGIIPHLTIKEFIEKLEKETREK